MNKVSIYKTEGIIIRAVDLGELDRLLFVYTRGYGKISVRAISARKKESKLRGLLEPFTLGQFVLAKSKTIDIVTDFEVANSFSYLHKNLGNLAYAYYFAELIDKLVTSPEDDENVWRLVRRVFEVLNSPQPSLKIREGVGPPLKLRGGEGELSQIRIVFENTLVDFLGYGKMGQLKPVQRLNYLQSLAGERLNSSKFLTQF
jgi:DNA repair protein RecO (recombination protein O)